MNTAITTFTRVSPASTTPVAARTLTPFERMHALGLASFATASHALVNFLEPFEASNALDAMLSRALNKARFNIAANTAV